MTKAYSRFLTALFCLFLGGMLVWSLVLPDRERSEVENRTLSQWPAFSWQSLKDGSFTSAVEEYFADQFPLRDQWTVLKARAEQMIGKSEFNGVYLCSDRLIAQVKDPEEELDTKNLSYVQRLSENTDVPVYLGLIPSAAEIWKDDLPAGAPSWDQSAFLQQAESLGLPMMDFDSALRTHADEDIFYRTDHHWTSLGAYYGYTALMEAMGMEPVDLADYERTTVTDQFYGTIFSASGVRWVAPDRIDTYIPADGVKVTSYFDGTPSQGSLYVDSYLEVKDKYSYFLGGVQPLCVVETGLTDAPRLLLIRDSYSDSLTPFLTQSFSQIHLFDPRYNLSSIQGYIQDNGIDAVAVLYSIPNYIADEYQFVLSR